MSSFKYAFSEALKERLGRKKDSPSPWFEHVFPAPDKDNMKGIRMSVLKIIDNAYKNISKDINVDCKIVDNKLSVEVSFPCYGIIIDDIK